MGKEEEGSPTPPQEASDIPAERRVSEAWLDFSDKSTEETRKGLVGYRRAVPRASARFALNPGLWDIETEGSEFTQYGGPSSQPNDAYASPTQSSTRQGSLLSETPENIS